MTPDLAQLRALRESEARWRAVFENSADAILIADEAGRIELVNPRAEALFGYARDELVGRPVEALLPEGQRERHAEHRRKFAADPEAERPMEGRTDLAGRHRDGHTIPLSIGLSVLESGGSRWTVAIVHDLTRQHALTERLRLLSAALGAAANGIAITDTNGYCQWINPGFERITGYSSDEIVGRRVSVLKSGVHDDAFFRDLWETITSGRSWHGEIHNRHRDGHVYVEEQTISPVEDAEGRITHFVAVKQDVTARRAMQKKLREANETLHRQLEEIESLQVKLREQAVRDPLTGLYNRRYLNDFLGPELARSRREGHPVAVVLLDVDRFKQVNDTHGHRAGDEALRHTAILLRARTREADTVCRYGGEEFLVVMPGASLEDAWVRAEGLRRSHEEAAVQFEGATIRSTISAGVAVFPDHAADLDSLMSAADEALYRAKATGRNRVVGYGEVAREDLVDAEP